MSGCPRRKWNWLVKRTCARRRVGAMVAVRCKHMRVNAQTTNATAASFSPPALTLATAHFTDFIRWTKRQRRICALIAVFHVTILKTLFRLNSDSSAGTARSRTHPLEVAFDAHVSHLKLSLNNPFPQLPREHVSFAWDLTERTLERLLI